MFNHSDICLATNPRCIGALAGTGHVQTDTRRLRSGDIFCALRGEQHDGHAFIAEAVKTGAAAVIIDHEIECAVPRYIVADTLKAYQNLAAYHRNRFALPVIGVTGSNGKTTVKELIWSILKETGSVLKNEKNFNNHIGVPLTLMKLDRTHTRAVIEMGMNHAGEIRVLSKIARPDAAVITCIGRAHLAFLGTVDAIAAAKAEIYDGMNPGGTVILPREDTYYDWLKRAAEQAGLRVKSFSIENSADSVCRVTGMRVDGMNGVLRIGAEDAVFTTRLTGRHNACNIAAAAAAVQTVAPELQLSDIVRVLNDISPVDMRCQVQMVNGITVILDCYNANPDSSGAALRFLSDITATGKKIALLGDMLELGEKTEMLHEEIGRLAAELKIDVLAVLGEHSEALAAGARGAGMPRETILKGYERRELARLLRQILHPGDVLLLKGSRKMKLEELLPALNGSVQAGEETREDNAFTGTRCENSPNSLHQSPTPKPNTNTNSTFGCCTSVMAP